MIWRIRWDSVGWGAVDPGASKENGCMAPSGLGPSEGVVLLISAPVYVPPISLGIPCEYPTAL